MSGGGRNDLKQCVLEPIVGMLRDDLDAHMFLFVNFRSDVRHCSTALEDLLASELMKEGVLSIHGHMDKMKKFAHMRLFTCDIVLRGHRSPAPIN